MPKDRKAPPLSSAQTKASPYCCSTKNTEKNISEKFVESIGNKKEWEEAICPICMEYPHNAILLLCSSHEKGCRPYMCNTSNRQSNCLNQFRKSSATSAMLLCPLCRGKINGWIVIKPTQRFMNSKPRSCSHEACEFSGTYSSLEKHARLVHPLVQPSKADPIRQHNWTELERERQTQDLLSASQREWEEEGSDRMTLEGGFGDTEIEVSFVSVERSSSPVNSLQQTTVSGGSGVVGRSRRFRTTPRMRVGNDPWHQLASRTGGYPPRQTQNIIGQI
ncbi:E3 ubiquitin-protein like [Actinidia chinensis var. chinensis]|uniref:E3 ubiquitin-protein like n=1 Tax=Actinidia chinensis var. chinensis TaxID=1590841 RepID=A0A2R6QZS1_ACTCC|nr:E3 ubiquitin-protein like [Actinidia chinensis var. chinensis]